MILSIQTSALCLIFLAPPFSNINCLDTIPEIPQNEWIGEFPRDIEPLPIAPSYESIEDWAAHPLKSEPLYAPKGSWFSRTKSLEQEKPLADVFFIHPTMYMEGDPWNAGVRDDRMNEQVDKWPIKHQASAFAATGRVFAPRYRQAHIRIFDLGDSLSHCAAALAYSDVKRAFQHYLEHWNDGRPIIIAGHSQGSYHGRTLLQEFFDGTALQEQLVAAYLPGMDMAASDFDQILSCEWPESTGCLCTWMTYAKGYTPGWMALHADTVRLLSTHPITWSTDTGKANKRRDHLGAVKSSFVKSKRGLITGELSPQGLLWIDEPHMVAGELLHRDNWHVGDINLFWYNIANNVQVRVAQWYAEHGTERPH